MLSLTRKKNEQEELGIVFIWIILLLLFDSGDDAP